MTREEKGPDEIPNALAPCALHHAPSLSTALIDLNRRKAAYESFGVPWYPTPLSALVPRASGPYGTG